MKKAFCVGLVAGAIGFSGALATAVSANSLSAKESYSQNSSDTSNTVFVCTAENTSSVMYAYTPGKAVLTPLMNWYQEYLLPETSSAEVCQQVATKLQELSQEKTVRYIATEEQLNQNVVCMVTQESGNCNTKDSEKLFAINSSFQPSCVLNRLKPLQCSATVVRGGILSVPDSPYRPIWWPW